MRSSVVRWRDPDKPKRGEPELDLHAAIAQYLDAVLMPPAFHTAIPAGGGGAWHGKRQKRKGYKSGFPDHMILSDRHAYLLEIKVGNAPLSAAQKHTIPLVKATHCPVAVVRSVDDVAALLRTSWWSIPTREHKPTPVDALRLSLAAQSMAASPED